MAKNLWTADRRLYLDKDGKAVEADDPARVSLLINVGGTLPMERAEALGLVSQPAEEQPTAFVFGEEKAAEPKANKGRRVPAENKGNEAE